MYELVNTSLPNGLIPGTHGFATVAATRGLPDAFRTRLEAYCAYAHRTSAHDASYFKENPVNWFHVTTPQGEHVTGRVAPADFDYTGRTNRIARLLVFAGDEMPSVGGAAVLKKEYSRFVAPWSGEVRWLDEDAMTSWRMRLEIPPETHDAPAWRAMFGDGEGVSLARRFAAQLAKNLADGGGTIYFKTSAALDADGTNLLALFADLVDLIPAGDRSKVTFSTFPAALPHGTSCNMRGVYDGDRFFEAVASARAWVDCENGIVHNASLLPQVEPSTDWRREDARPREPYSFRREGAPALPERPRSPRPFARRVPNLQTLLSKEPQNILAPAIVAGLALVFVFVVLGLYWYAGSKRTSYLDGDTEFESSFGDETIRPIVETNGAPSDKVHCPVARVPAPCSAASSVRSDGARAVASETTEVISAKAGQRKARGENEHSKRERSEQSERSEKERERPSAEFAEAANVIVCDAGLEAKIASKEKTFLPNGSLRVFWYDNGIFTNALSGFEPSKNRTVRGVDWQLDPMARQLAGKTSGMVLIWYHAGSKTAYWDWTPLGRRSPEKWFANADSIDLVDFCFGKEPKVYAAWKERKGAPCFRIERIDADGETHRHETPNRRLDLRSVAKELFEAKKRAACQMAEKLAAESHVDEYRRFLAGIADLKGKYDRHRKNLMDRQYHLKGLSADKRKAVKKEIEGEKKAIKSVFEEMDDMRRKWANVDKRIKSRWKELTVKDNAITGWDRLIENLQQQIDGLAAKQDEQQAKGGGTTIDEATDAIRRSRFRVIEIVRSR